MKKNKSSELSINAEEIDINKRYGMLLRAVVIGLNAIDINNIHFSPIQRKNGKLIFTVECKKFTAKERKYLKLGGIDDGFTIEEKDGYLASLSKKEKRYFDEYDSKANCCSYCIKNVPTDIFKNRTMTRKTKRCPNCGKKEL